MKHVCATGYEVGQYGLRAGTAYQHFFGCLESVPPHLFEDSYKIKY